MKLTISSRTLFNAMQSISRIVPAKSALPILECFLFDLTPDALYLTAYDNETRVTTSIALDTPKKDCGKIAINAKLILPALKTLPEQIIELDVNEESYSTIVTTSSGYFEFVASNAATYPIAKPLADNSTAVSLDTSILISAINQTIFATSKDDLRPIMMGVCFDLFEDHACFVASDGNKMSRYKNKTVYCDTHTSFVLPTRPAAILKSMLDSSEPVVALSFDSNRVVFTTPTFTMEAKLIVGRYPNYNSVIPKSNSLTATVDRNALVSAIKRTSVFSNPATSLVSLYVNGCTIRVSCRDIDFATKAEETIMCQSNIGEFAIGLKSTFLSEILSVISSEEIMFHFGDATRAVLVTPVNADKTSEAANNEESLFLLMPMMLDV